MNTDDHKPLVLTLRGTDFAMLVCGRQFLHTGIDHKETGSVRFNTLFFPVAIQLSPVTKILYEVESGAVGDAEWDSHTPPVARSKEWNWPVLHRSATTALAEAYRTVGDPTSTGWQRKTTRVVLKPEVLWAYKEGTVGRNLQAWLAWDTWNRLEYTIEQRAQVLRNLGYQCTGRALERAAQERGIS